MSREKNIILTARVMSMVFTPFYLPIVGLLSLFFLSYLSLMPLGYKLQVLTLVYFFTILLPTVLIHLYRKYNGWNLIELGHKERRMVPYVISILCYFFCVYIMDMLHIPHFMGTIVSAATVAGVMIVLNKTYGFKSGALAAPQANAMAAVIAPLMNGQGAPWLLYGIGAVIALILDRFKVSALAFALGMFIPLQLNVPLLIGGAVHSFVTSRSKDETVNKARGEKGTLLASGFIAGGALMGVVSALLKFGGVDFDYSAWWENVNSEWLSLAAYLLLISIFIIMTRPSKK